MSDIELARSLFDIFTDKQQELLEYDIDVILSGDSYIVAEKNLLINKQYTKSLYKFVRQSFLSQKSTDTENMHSLMIVILNPSFGSAWSRRKMCIVEKVQLTADKHRQLVIQDELRTNRLVLMKHFKCEHAYMYRRWLIRMLVEFNKRKLTLQSP
jgi:hypothetical protein